MQILLAALVIMLEDASVVLLTGTDGQESLKHIYGITANLLKGAHTKENKVLRKKLPGPLTLLLFISRE
nr:hypothetical protein CFP56_42549 [Quercus suber]